MQTKNSIEFGPGELFICPPGEPPRHLGTVTGIELEPSATETPLHKIGVDLPTSQELTATLYACRDTLERLTRMAQKACYVAEDAVIFIFCPNRRLVHLALRHKKARVRKKNHRRAMAILKGGTA